MSSRTSSQFGSLAQRVGSEPGRRPVRWVRVDGVDEGLLGRWRRVEDRWEALVARVGGPDDFYAEWIPAKRLEPVTPAP